jgi:hypothetical protein
MKYAKSSKGYYIPKDGSAPEPKVVGMATDNTPDPLAQFSQAAQGAKAVSFTEAGFKKGYSYGDKDLYIPTNFGAGASQTVNIDGADYTIAFAKDKNADNYNAVLVDKSGNVRPGNPRDQVANSVLANFQNLNASKMANALYNFGITKTTSQGQNWSGPMTAVQGTM